MSTDTFSNLLTQLRNAVDKGQKTVFLPKTKYSQKIVEILFQERLIDHFEEVCKEGTNDIFLQVALKYKNKKPVFSNLKRISKPGLRIYTRHKDITKVFNGIGITLISTSKGIMTDKNAAKLGLGGELLCSIW
uniref:Small ribosomal subunit protein uS8c n=1 Tax=Prasinococcus sp. CCMP1194 TaxID=110672 RepID=A0A088CJZ5_9VIRI|nr:ribosomal protein S8 [Prasinococcus sp. CCMP1194]